MRAPSAFVLLGLAALAGCGGEGSGSASGSGGAGGSTSEAPPLPWAAEKVPAAREPADNPTTQPKVDLGRLLFYDPILSSDRAVACATCHSEEWGMSDGLPLSIGTLGVGPTGPGRTGPNLTRRNSLTLWNVANRSPLFWDGRAATLEDQVLAPLKEPKELGRDPDEVAKDLGAIPGYVTLFQAAFPKDSPAVTVTNMQRALAAFERSLISDRAPYDHYVAGDSGALSDDAVKGMFLFAEAGCAGCHAPPLFESMRFFDRGVAPVPGVADDGRGEVTHERLDQGAFRVPTLRNVRESGPYFHTGAVASLEDAVKQEAARSPKPLSDDDITAIVTFLDKGLIDPSRSPDRPAQVPSGLPVPLDGFRIPR